MTSKQESNTVNKKSIEGISALLQTLMLIPYSRSVSAQELTLKLAELNIHRNPRSVKRYLDEVIIELFNVERDERSIPHTYRKTADNLLKFGPREALVFCLIDKYLAPLLPEHILKTYNSKSKDSQALLYKGLPLSKERLWLNKVAINIPSTHHIKSIFPDTLVMISRALFDNRLITLNSSSLKLAHVQVEPLGLIMDIDSLSLVYRQQAANAISKINLTLIDTVKISTFHFDYPNHFDLEDYLYDFS